MFRHLTLGVAAVLAAAASVGVSPQSPQPLTWTGAVSIVTSPDGRDTIVSIDEEGGGRSADGLVEHAFRLQHEPGARFEFLAGRRLPTTALIWSSPPLPISDGCSRSLADRRMPSQNRSPMRRSTSAACHTTGARPYIARQTTWRTC